MPHYLLDTDICSYAIKRKQPELLSKIRAGLAGEALAISAITRGELLYGLEIVPNATTLKLAVLAFLEIHAMPGVAGFSGRPLCQIAWLPKDDGQSCGLYGHPDCLPCPR